MTPSSHTFVVPAYGASPHLAACLESLRNQTLPSRVLVSTSTPYAGLDAVCDQFGADLHVHSPNRGIAYDWNEGLRAAQAEWVTLAHQDDVYLSDFLSRTMALIERWPDATLAFTDYVELVGNRARERTAALRFKRALVEMGMLGRLHVSSRWGKQMVLRLGCSIPCPAVTLRVSRLDTKRLFSEKYRVNLDWDMWWRVASEVPGAFVRDRGALMQHRIHLESETTSGIAEGVRAAEDLELFERMWPKGVARLIARAYSRSYRYNRI